MTDLQECRQQIDKIDDQIVKLFEERMKVCEEVAQYKIRTGKQVLDPQRNMPSWRKSVEKPMENLMRWEPRSFFSRSWLSAGSASTSSSQNLAQKKRKIFRW